MDDQHPQWLQAYLGPWITNARFHTMCRSFCSTLRRGNYDAVVGVPRSGLLPAAMASLSLGVPLWSLDTSGVVRLDTGQRLRSQSKKPVTKLLVIDDSCASGRAMKKVKGLMKLDCMNYDVTFAAVIVTSNGKSHVDLHHEVIELPHWFEWNFFGNSKLIAHLKLGVDFEGIIQDPESGDLNPMIPRHTHIPVIVSKKLITEKPDLLTWLAQRDISCDHLVMPEVRQGLDELLQWKAKQCDALDVWTYMSYASHEAWAMTKLRNKLVICPAVGRSLHV